MNEMHQLSVFKFEEAAEIRVIKINDEPWFVAKDIAEILGYSETAMMTRRLDGDETISAKLAGMNMNSTLINESGLYNSIIGSNKPEAKRFKKWVTAEVLPSIRKHGAYVAPVVLENWLADPARMIEALTALKDERARRKELEDQVAADRSRVVFAESIEIAQTSILVGEMAKLINQSTGYIIGQNRFFEYLRENGYIHRFGEQRNLPTQRSIEAGWMEIKEGSRFDNNGVSHLTRTPKITGKGQIYFINLFKDMNRCALEKR